MKEVVEFVSHPANILPILGFGLSLGALGYLVFGHYADDGKSAYERWKNKGKEPKQLEFDFKKYPK